MNILIATDQYYPTLGGIIVATDQLIRELARNSHTVSLLAPSATRTTQTERVNENLTIYRINSFSIFKKKGIRFAYNFKSIKQTIDTIKPDLIHVATPGVIGVTSLREAKKLGIPVVATNHIVAENITAAWNTMPHFIEAGVEKIAMEWLRNIYQQADHMISPSGAAADHLRKLGITKPITVISNGLYLKIFVNPNLKILKSLKEKLQLPKKPRILYVGRFDKEKQVDLLIEAFAALRNNFDAQLLLAGKGLEEELLKAQIAQKNLSEHVTIVGYLSTDELAALYHLVDVFVMPSVVELQSIATMEAMASHLPVIGANAMALPYLIHPNKNGFLFEPGNSLDLSEKLLKILADEKLKVRMGNKSFEYVQEHDMAKVVKKFEELYESEIEKNKRVRKITKS